MKTSVILSIIGMLIGFISCNDLSSSDSPIPHRSYSDSLKQWRRTWDKELKTNPKSPIPKEHIESFTGLQYFSPDSQWIQKAFIKPPNHTEIIEISTTTDRIVQMIPFGEIRFTISEQNYVLTTFQDLGNPKGKLFIPFTDLTNGTDTYGGGRYLDIEIPQSDSFLLDFNRAYNPYCVYNHSFSCPIPPESNFINVRITAGEKNIILK